MQQALQALNQADVIRIGFPADKVLFQPFESEKQPGELFQGLSVKVLQVLKNITPGRVPVDPAGHSVLAFFPVKPCDRKRAHFEFVHELGIKFQVRIVHQHQVAAQGFKVTVAHHEAVVVLADRQAVIGLQNQGQKSFVFGFDQAKLRAFAFQAKSPIIRQDFKAGRCPFDFDDLLIGGPVQGF
jgi:hypothetical protein